VRVRHFRHRRTAVGLLDIKMAPHGVDPTTTPCSHNYVHTCSLLLTGSYYPITPPCSHNYGHTCSLLVTGSYQVVRVSQFRHRGDGGGPPRHIYGNTGWATPPYSHLYVHTSMLTPARFLFTDGLYKEDTSTHAQGTAPRVALGSQVRTKSCAFVNFVTEATAVGPCSHLYVHTCSHRCVPSRARSLTSSPRRRRWACWRTSHRPRPRCPCCTASASP